MREIERIEDQLRRAFEGDAWHGPSVREALEGVTAEKAAARPLPGAHSIWEIVLHLAGWSVVVRRRIEERKQIAQPDEGDWPAVTDVSEDAWREAVARLEKGYSELRALVSSLDDTRLDELAVKDGETTVYFQLHGKIQHYLYHAGQIMLLRK